MPTRSQHSRRPRLALLAVALTVVACLAALLFRTPLRARYWAWRIEHTDDLAERGLYLGGLCNAGEEARWGVNALLACDQSDVRQCGVLVLHHARSVWARARLLELITDADPDVRRLAALGLAMHGDHAVIPTLKWLYQTADDDAAATACLAFERLGTPEAVAALNELAGQPSDVGRRAALVDAFEGIGAAECARGLLLLLRDQRTCDRPGRQQWIIERALDGLRGAGYVDDLASRPGDQRPARTVAERAARALSRITGLSPGYSSDAPSEERAAAEQTWRDWLAARSAGA